jgi:TetR/AcrR family transcriptional regulator, transcriptional repressor for nem operon
MKVSREQVAENRRKILDAASQLFRSRGFEAVTIAEVMSAAGLTHGGFYGHFKSKDDLIAQTLAHVLGGGAQAEIDLLDYAARYLAPDHRDDLAGGCPTAGLAAEVIRQAPDARKVMTEGVRRQIERLSQIAPGKNASETRRAAIGSWAAMVGAVILARLVDDPALSDELLEQTRAWIGSAGGKATKRTV